MTTCFLLHIREGFIAYGSPMKFKTVPRVGEYLFRDHICYKVVEVQYKLSVLEPEDSTSTCDYVVLAVTEAKRMVPILTEEPEES